MQPGMSFYGELPDTYSLIVNTSNSIIAGIKQQAMGALEGTVAPMADALKSANDKIEAIRKEAKDGKLDAEQQKQTSDLEAEASKARKEQEDAVAAYAATQPVVKQVIDLALLGNGLLKGAELTAFISRSVDMLK